MADERQTLQSDSEEMFRTAQEMLDLRLSPDEFRRAVAMVEAASELGCAAASEFLALLWAVGVERRQSWTRAFAVLAQAAEQGSATAKAQLQLLSDPHSEPQADGDADWRDLAASISVDRLLSHERSIQLSEAPRIGKFEAFLSRPYCDWLMRRAEPLLSKASVLKKSGEKGYAEGRSNDAVAFRMTTRDVVIEVVRQRIAAAMQAPASHFEPTQVFRYSVGQEFRPHFDFFDPTNPAHETLAFRGQRTMTLIIYLNSDFEGGETEFPSIGLRTRGNVGDAIYWANVGANGQPDQMTLHSGLPPTSGEKWILSQWIRERPRPA